MPPRRTTVSRSSRRAERHRVALLAGHEHIDHPVLEHLEVRDCFAELLARLGIFAGEVGHHAQAADSFCTIGGVGFIDDALNHW